jgi:adenylosuccinate synthase
MHDADVLRGTPVGRARRLGWDHQTILSRAARWNN